MRLRGRVRNSKTSRQKPREFESKMVMAWKYFQAGPDWKTWIGYPVSRSKAIAAVAEGRAELITRRGEDGVVRQVGIRWKTPLRAENPSPTVLTRTVMRVVSGEFQQYDRPTRGESALLKKYAVWPLVHDTKATCVGARQTPEEKALAECLLGVHGRELQSAFERIVERTGRAA